ncbi:MAG: AMP-binding protein [Terriglobia bacterium]
MQVIPKQVEAGSVEGQILDVVRELLLELGSERAAANLSMDSLLDRDLGLGSLERVELLVRLEARFKTRLPEEAAQEAETPSDWSRAIFDGARPAAGHQRYRIIQPARLAPEAPVSAKSWPEVLRRFAQIEPDRVQIHLLEEDSGRDITYGQLLETASRVAAGLIDAGLRPKETVAIMLPTCADFFYAFFGVMLAGGVAVPIYPPARADKIEEYVRRQVLILKNAEVRFLVSFDRVRAVSQIMRLSIPSLIGVTSVEVLGRSGAKLPTRGLEPAEIAFIQYTSGSTGDPKGVVLTHSNVLANVRGIGSSVHFRSDDYVVSWLPLYHDMGLIGSWLFSVYHGAPITLMSPLAFLSRPERWMWAMHDSRGTLCPAPNFSYELCARKIPAQAIEGLDLSHWRVAINAGEAVLPDTLARFEERFRSYGFRSEAFVPCYGLAESSVALSFTSMNRRPVIDAIRRDLFESEGKAVSAKPGETNVLRFVANGRPMPDHEVKLLDDEGGEVGERLQGRIFFRGPSRTAGYYRNPKATSAVITADGWMDSGDLGYWAGGELYVTGRLKDCIIKSGRNIIPQEIEAAAAEVPGIRKGCVAAFGALDTATGTERLVVVAETRAAGASELQRIEEGVVKAVDAVLGIPPDKVVLVAPQSIPKTSSGKIRRNATRTLYLEGRLSGRRRPPWMQLARLWLENTGNGLKHWRGRSAAWLHRSVRAACFGAVAYSAGVAVRLLPGRNARLIVAKFAARAILRLGAHSVHTNGNVLPQGVDPAVLISNRAGYLDPLVAMAYGPGRFLFADLAPLSDLPAAAEFLLKCFLAPRVAGITSPPGGTPGARINRCLANGFSVLVFADGPVGAPPLRSRFRLDSLRAAATASAPVYPVIFRGTEGISWPDRHSESRARSSEIGMEGSAASGRYKDIQPCLLAGKPLRPTGNNLHDMIQLRERIRESLAALDNSE